MKVKCISKRLTEDQARELSTDKIVSYRITPGIEYTVMGISSFTKNGKNTILYWLKDDPGNYLVPTPYVLFEVADARASRHWVIQIGNAGLKIFPEEFLVPGFLEALTDLDPKKREVFSEIAEKMEYE